MHEGVMSVGNSRQQCGDALRCWSSDCLLKKMTTEVVSSGLWGFLFACTLYCPFCLSVGDGANQTVARYGRYEFITYELRTTKIK